jgi:glycosyltransferase involved in cell wall biosynthesis
VLKSDIKILDHYRFCKKNNLETNLPDEIFEIVVGNKCEDVTPFINILEVCYNNILKNYKKIFAISTSVQEDVRKRSGIFSPIVYNGIEIEKYEQRCTYDFDKEKDVFNIILLSRLFPEQKGQHIAIQAIQILKKQDINIKLYFVGNGNSDELTRLKELVAECDVDTQVEFTGRVDRQWIKSNLKNYHLLIQPSLFEGFGLTVVEGFACGLPVIASDLDGPKEICELLNAGLLINPNDPVDLAEKIYRIYQSYISNTLGENGYILQEKNRITIFDIQTTAKLYLNYYVL